MLPISYRLTKRNDFQKVFENGKFFSIGSISLICAPNAQETSRIGFVVSKKVSKKAVDRNRIRRILREALRPMVTLLKPGMDAVIMYRGTDMHPEFDQMSRLLSQLLKKSNLLK